MEKYEERKWKIDFLKNIFLKPEWPLFRPKTCLSDFCTADETGKHTGEKALYIDCINLFFTYVHFIFAAPDGFEHTAGTHLRAQTLGSGGIH